MRLADQLRTFDRNFTSNQRQLTIRDANEKNCITKERERERFSLFIPASIDYSLEVGYGHKKTKEGHSPVCVSLALDRHYASYRHVENIYMTIENAIQYLREITMFFCTKMFQFEAAHSE